MLNIKLHSVYMLLLLLEYIKSQDFTAIDELIHLNKSNFYTDDRIKYDGEHVVLNPLIAYEGSIVDYLGHSDPLLFFNEVDILDDGSVEELGQYVLVNGTVHRIFDGRTSATDTGSLDVYFGASDGLYVYDETDMTAHKLGNINQSIVQLQTTNGTGQIYILTEPDYILHVVDKNGNYLKTISEIKYAKSFVLDRRNNVFFIDGNNRPNVLPVGSNQPLKFLFNSIEDGFLVRPPKTLASGGVPMIANDGREYLLLPNGTSESTPFHFIDKPTGVSMDVVLIQYFAFDGNLYEFIVERR